MMRRPALFTSIGPLMLLSLRLETEKAQPWHLRLLTRLSQDPGVTVMVEPVEGHETNTRAERLLHLEARLRGRQSAERSIMPSALAAYRFSGPRGPDVTLDLSETDRPVPGRHWQLFVDDQPGESALLTSIVRGQSPLIEIREQGAVIAAGRVGTESKGLLAESIEDAQARVATLIIAALSGSRPSLPSPQPSEHQREGRLTLGQAAHEAIAIVSRRARGRLHRLFYQSPHWRVGWRKYDGADLFDLRRHPAAGWHDLPDDRLRFYADPFPILVGDTVTLFVEEYPHATGKGIISAVPFGPDGPIGRPEPVLERPYHLSYPFVFASAGEIWMVPESCAAATIDLYRATRFPGGWVKETTLVAGVEASDATLYQAEDRWWLFATVKDGGSYSDALHLWSAPDFRGPWTSHPRNPVLIDIAGARPAGRLVRRGGTLYRPVQDCRDGYGAALGFARVLQLDDDSFAQDIETVLTAGPRWPGSCLHTVNEAGGFEFIDGSGRARKPLRSVGR